MTVPSKGAAHYAYRAALDAEVEAARGSYATVLAHIFAVIAQLEAHTHGGGGVVATIVASEAALGTGATDGELKWTLDGGFKLFFWNASTGKWSIAFGRWATEPSAVTYSVETGTVISVAGVAMYYTGAAWTNVDTTASTASIEADIDTLQNNLAVLAFHLAVEQAMSREDFDDGFWDVFTDQDGVDDDNCVGAVYVASGDYYHSLAVLASNTTGSSNYYLGYSGTRNRVAQSFQLAAGDDIYGINIKINNTAGSPTGPIYIRIETNNSGVPSGTLVDAGATAQITSPAVGWNAAFFASAISLSGTTTYWIVLDCDDQASGVFWYIAYHYSDVYADGNSAESTNGGTSWTTQAGRDMVFEVLDQPENMVLIAEPDEAEFEPDEVKIIFVLEDVEAATLNTDVMAWAATAAVAVTGITAANPAVVTAPGHELSATDKAVLLDVAGMTQINGQIVTVASVDGDNVTTDIDASGFSAWTSGGLLVPLTQITLADEGDFDTGQKLIAGSSAMPDRTDDDMTVRIVVTTHNNKHMRLHMWAALYK